MGDARPETPAQTSLVAGYGSSAGRYDELLDAAGAVRPQWQTFLRALERLPARDRFARAARLDREVRETGLAHDAFVDPEAPRQAWRLNLAPVIVSASEWAWLEQAMAQRARLFSAMLDDIYGPQTMMRAGTLPPDVVFSDPTYLRACQGLAPKGGHLQFYAADLARGLDGTWRVIDNHTETPAGIGYVVANRMMHADVFDDLFVECNGRRLARHFMDLQQALAERGNRSDPTIALLTPGPDHDDYFAHAYLARYLDLHLVEGGDLRVAGNDLCLKSLDGLKRVDVLIRCTEGRHSDPLELDPDGFLGPSGLMHACRGAGDLVLNALGSAVAESRALGSYLPALCRSLLGEELMLADAPRWWLGDPAAREYVIGNLENMILRPVREGTGRPGRATTGRQAQAMTAAERQALVEDIRRNGAALVAEARLGVGTTPSLSVRGLRPKPFGMRLYASATSRGFGVLPGGLAMGIDADAGVALSTRDGETHDVWVLADGPEQPHTSLWQPRVAMALVQRSQRTLQSRVADNLFWLGRYLERADWTMRVIRTSLARRVEYLSSPQSRNAGDVCLERLARQGAAESVSAAAQPSARSALALARHLAAERSGHFSLPQTFDGIYRVANLTRDRLSLEAWRTISALAIDEAWRQRMQAALAPELLDMVEDRLALIATFNGHMHESMTRNFGWSFLDMGRRLERAVNLADALSQLFRQSISEEEDVAHLGFILRLADSFITYRSRYRLQPMLPLVLDLLVKDETNPRSIAYQIAAIERHLEGLPKASEGNQLPRERRIVLALGTALRLADVNELGMAGREGARSGLEQLLGHVTAGIPDLSDAISRRYFRLAEETPHRIGLRGERDP